MEIGNEISQKIRSAIKAKLVDLGAYVDDELPDYIMVMVANKKSQSQMTEDLNLFLGNNTEKFTSWLHGLLNKLQSITADPPKLPEAPPGGETEDLTRDIESAMEDKFEEEELTIRPEHDDFEEEARKEDLQKKDIPRVRLADVAAAPKLLATVEVNKTVPTPKAVSVANVSSRLPLKSTASNSTSKSLATRKALSPKRDQSSVPLSSQSQVPENSTLITVQRQRAVVRKRRAPGSVVATVIHHEVEEEYDPRRPLIGRVASTVKVGQRRPTVPPAQQANKSLLLKAMSEAHQSISKTTHRPADLGGYQTVEEATRERWDAAPRRTGPTEYRSRQDAREPYGGLRSSATMPRVTRVTLMQERSDDSSYKSETEAERSIQLYSRSKREEVLQQLRAGLHSESSGATSPDDTAPQLQAAKRETLDNRYVRLSEESPPPVELPLEKRTITVLPEEIKQEESAGVIDTLIESGAEESDFTDDEQEQRIVQKKPPSPVKEPPGSPKFVVTLDGVDPAMLSNSTLEYMDMDQESYITLDETPKAANIVRVAPQRIQTSTPIDFEFTDVDSEDGVAPAKRARKPERCKFWLACRNGNHCKYHHPTVPCKMFPNCKFGEKCLYIHPNCRFDASCTRDSCPYTHATKRAGGPPPVPVVLQPFQVVAPFQSTYVGPPTTQASKQPVCKFFPKCTNMNCTYRHPKPCRFGIGCREKSVCAFSHPELPKVEQLRWAATKDTSMQSGR